MEPFSNKSIFPIYTSVAEHPVTIFKSIDPKVFEYPFFNQGVNAMGTFQGDVHAYQWEDLQIDAEADLLSLNGFIFHTAHCGSTLLARMLGKLPAVRVVSEPEAINGILLSYLFHSLPEKDVLLHLKRIIEAYRQPAKEKEIVLFKLTSWNVFFIHMFQQLYPDVPWLYLDRDTEEVVQSLLETGGGFTEWWDHPVDILRRYFIEHGYVCQNKHSFLQHMVDRHRLFARKYKNARSCFLNYPDFINEFEAVILPHLNLQFSKNEVQEAMQMTKYESKQIGNVLFESSQKG